MIKAVIFDCFGVLLGNTYKQRLVQLDQEDPSKAQEFRSLNYAADKGILSREDVTEQMAELLELDVDELLDEQAKGETRNQPLLDFIATLKPGYQLAVLSNVSSRDRLGIRFEPGQLDSLFNTIVASGDEGYVKPEPEIYEITATRLGVMPAECLFVDDIEEYCQGARETGMQAIQFITTDQAIHDINDLLHKH